MNHLIKRALQGAMLVGGLWVIGQGIASADTVQAPGQRPRDRLREQRRDLQRSRPPAARRARQLGTTASDGSTSTRRSPLRSASPATRCDRPAGRASPVDQLGRLDRRAGSTAPASAGPAAATDSGAPARRSPTRCTAEQPGLRLGHRHRTARHRSARPTAPAARYRPRWAARPAAGHTGSAASPPTHR